LKSVMSATSMPSFCEEDAMGHLFWEGKGTGSGGASSRVVEGGRTARRSGARPIAFSGG
jgi:hypothetical protein